ncbi:NRPS [Trichoderma atroviride]|uniref:NRPS n=1 Tax=Hypocrea atroviridis TaxID=63577 RepID=UPI00331B143F|nr:NRPS [Trichoderma atroviride]
MHLAEEQLLLVQFSPLALERFSETSTTPATETERIIHSLVADVIGIEESAFGVEDDIFRLGANSITAMSLASIARTKGLRITVPQILQNPTVQQMASLIQNSSQGKISLHGQPTGPLSLSPKPGCTQALRQLVSRKCHIDESLVEAAYPCTSLQASLFLRSLQDAGSYMIRYEWAIPGHLDLHKFREAWDLVFHKNDILRTRFVEDDDSTIWQAVIREKLQWRIITNESQIKDNFGTGFGKPLLRLGLFQGHGTEQTSRFIFEAHHSIMDAWSCDLVLDAFSKAYNIQSASNQLPNSPQFGSFVNYIQSIDKKESECFWKEQYSDFRGHRLPLPSSALAGPRDSLKARMLYKSSETSQFTVSEYLRGAWAIVISSFSEEADIVLGIVESGRDISLSGIENLVGPTIATLPVRIQVLPTEQIIDFMQKLRHQRAQMVHHQHFGLQNIASVSVEAGRGCEFQNLLVIQAPVQRRKNAVLRVEDAAIGVAMTEYPIVLECFPEEGAVSFVLDYDASVMATTDAQKLLAGIRTAFQQLREGSTERILGDLTPTISTNKPKLELWNSNLPRNIKEKIHHLISDQARNEPLAPAIMSWDGEMNFRQLDHISTQLGEYLNCLGYGAKSIIPVSFEKSMWYIIAVLGTLKAGAAFLPLDPSQPIGRLHEIVGQVQADVCLVSKETGSLFPAPQFKTIPVSQDGWPRNANDGLYLSKADITGDPEVPRDPSNLAYIIFTSGSTGKPKGVMIEHDSFCSGACVRAELIHRNKDSRVFSFSSYSFDTSIEDVLTTLIVGGCVCIPSEYESKNELAEAIRRYRANTLDTTPSAVAAISPEDTPGLTTIILGGEAMTADNVAKWASRVTLINTYGPSECSIVSTVAPPAAVDTDPSNIGRGVGCITWIVDENDHERLMPIGEVGELLIEGPIVGRGYHGDASHEAFLCNTKWRSTFNLKPSWRFYKTGDLARYATDGSIVFVGRKDSQCKIRGQRVEVAEIEYRLRDGVAHEQVAVECIPIPGLGPTIVGFLGDKAKDESSDAVLHTAGSLPPALSSIQSHLLTHLPTYMVPSFYVEVGHLPMQISGKLGRGALRSIFMKLYKTQCSTRNAVAAAESAKQPQHFIGIALQTLWARQLGIRATSIGLHDTFFALGGNSLKAMQLVTQCRKASLSLTVEDIFKGPSLEKMTASVLSRTSATTMPVSDGQNNAELSRLRDTLPTVDNATIQEVCAACGITANLIQYVYPCSPLQELFMRGSLHQPGSYIATHIFKIVDDADPHKLVEAWSTIAKDSCILRTRLVQTESAGLVQVVLHETLVWKKAATLDECRRNSEPMAIQSGSPLSQLYLVEGEESYLAWTAHHAIYDAWMLDQLTEALRAAYTGTWVRPKAEYRDYIRYIKTLDSDATRQFWKTQLASPSSAGRFVKQDQRRHTLRMERSLEQTVQVTFPNTSNLAFSTYIRAAWALTVSEYGESEDVIFGIVLAGRAIQLADVDTIMAPTIATAPLRIQLDRKSTITNFLQLVQNQSASVMPHEQFGVQNIKELNQDCWEACDFESLLDIHPMVDHVQPNTIIELESSRNDSQSFHTHPLVLTCRPNQKSLDLECVFDESMVDQTQALQMVHHFAHMLRQLVHIDGLQSLTQLGTEGTLADLERISPFDKALLHQWNSTEYCAVQNFVHEKVRAQVMLDAKRPAIEAWDGNFTYGELDIVSSRLAVYLQDIGVGDKPIIPLCFSKSAWAVVAMLAVLKIGGAYAALDPSHPSERLRMMVNHTKATLVLAGKEHAAMFDGQVEHVVVLHDLLLAELPQPPIKLELKAPLDPQDAALIVFTSGSTGVPKGVVLQHDAFCTLADGMAAEMNFSADSRVLQFAAYAFDVSSSEIFLTLIHGGCCCIPSDADRLSNLAGVIADFRINWLYLTPTVANLVLPEDVENVKTLVLGGEAARQELIDKFANRTCLINSYGPAEGTIWPSMAKFSASSSPSDIGSGTRCHMWLVDPNNHDQLVPIGVPGEILLEGPMVARGYLFDEAKTKAVFIDPPNWATPRRDGLRRRFYKVGDMARQKADGTLSFLGRKDTQVKLRGQRIELGEIEFRIAKNSQTIKAAAVEVANLNRQSQVLVAFVSFSGNVDICYENNIGAVTTPIRNDLLALQESLSKHLPPYMIPSFYIPLEQLPKTLSQKLDRRALRTLFENIPRSNLKEYSLSLHSTRKASSPLERQVQSLWARILNIKPQDIGMHDSPVRLGANSLTAIQASTLARKEGLNMPVTAILRAKSLAEICDATSPIRHLEEQPLEAFGLLKKGDKSDFKILMAEIEDQCNVDQAQIEDAYPCTPLQEGMILHSENRPGSYVAQRIFRLDPAIDVARFRSAWCNVAKLLNGFVSPGSKLVKPSVDKSPLSKTVKHSIQDFGIGRCPVTGPSLIRAAWGLLLGSYYDSRDVTFGTVTNGRSTAVPGIMDLCGPTMSIIPTRVKIDDEMNLHSFLVRIQNQGLEAIPFAQYGMQYIQRIDPSTRAACQFETLLDIDIQNDKDVPDLFGSEERPGTVEAFHTYAIVLGARITSDRLEFEMEFDSRRISESHIHGILRHLERIIQQLKNSSDMSSVGALRATLEGEKGISDTNLTKSVASLPPQQEVALSSLGETTTGRQGPLETKLHALISMVLQVDPAEIGIHDHFIAMGGDSISAMHLASLARRSDIPLTASDVFRHPTIYGMAQHCSKSMTDSIVETAQSQTPTARSQDDAIRRHVSTSLQIPMSDVQDIVPATDFQAWAVAGDLMKSRGWSNYVIITFSSPLDKERLLTAFKTVIERNAILRTAFVAFGSQILQVVRRKPYLKHEHLRRNTSFQQEIHAWVDSMIANGQDSAISEGSVRMITTGPTSESVCALAMTLSHAQSDATSLSHIGSDLSDAFDGRVLPTRPSFSIFAARATSIEQQKEAECFWRTELHRARMTKVTQLSPPSHSYQYPVAKTYTRTIPTPERRKHTFATALKAAWALTLAKHTKQSDIVFGHLVSGRTLPISGVEDMVGPCLNIVPVRIRIPPRVTTESLLDAIQDRYLASMPHETLGFNRIVEACTAWPRSTRYSSILQHQNIADVPSLEFNNGKTQADVDLRCPSHDSTDIWVISIPKGNTIEVTLSCNDNLVPPYEAQTLLGSLIQAIAMFMSDDACTVVAQDEIEWERDGTRRLPREGDKLQMVDGGGVSLGGQKHSLLHKVREIWQNALFTSPEEVDYISPTTPYYKVRGGHAATVLLLAQYKAQIAPHITMEEVIDHPTLEDHVQLLLAKQNTKRVGSRNS